MPKIIKKKKTRSQIGKNNRRKGGQAERDVVNMLMGNGTLAQRVSMLESGGISKGDIQFKKVITDDWEICQVKNELAVPEYIYKNLEGYNFMFARKPRRKWVVVVDLDYFIKEYL